MVKVCVTDVDWCITEDDVVDQNEMEKILNNLPTIIHMDIDADRRDVDGIEEQITEHLSNAYGWLINEYSYFIED